jgi:hypothetical protein
VSITPPPGRGGSPVGGGMSQTQSIDTLIWKWRNCTTYDECSEAFRKIVEYVASNYIPLVEWSQFEAWGKYYISPDGKSCVYIAKNPRVDPTIRVVEKIEFKDIEELANRIWRDQKGVIPFKKIRERIREIFGVDVKMSDENKFVLMLFGEAGDR